MQGDIVYRNERKQNKQSREKVIVRTGWEKNES